MGQSQGGQRGPGGQGGFGGGQPGQGGGDPEQRRRSFQERMANMTPEERAQFEARMRERGIDPATMTGGMPGGRDGSGQRGPVASGMPGMGRPAGDVAATPNRAGAQTIDQLFGPLPVTESSGRVWLHVNGQLKMVRVRLGITDGTYTELLTGELQAGQELVTAVVTPAQAAAASTRSPLMPGGPGRPGQGNPMQGGGQRGGPGGH